MSGHTKLVINSLSYNPAFTLPGHILAAFNQSKLALLQTETLENAEDC